MKRSFQLSPWLPLGLGALVPLLALGGAPIAAHALLHPLIAACFVSATLPNCSWFGPVVTRFATRRREVWLTIDDGPDPNDTPHLLDLLDAAGAKATFFLIGAKAERRPALVEEIWRRGHEVGNHSYSHNARWFWSSPPGLAAQEIGRAQSVLGRRPTLFRAPVGMANYFVHRAAAAAGLTLTGWSLRTLDTRGYAAEFIARKIAARIAPGAIILLHEGHRHRDGSSQHPALMRAVLRVLREGDWQAIRPAPESWLSRGRPLRLNAGGVGRPADSC